MMEKQIHLRIESDRLDFSKTIYHFEQPDALTDRIGGFWTSTFDETRGCEWLHNKIYKPFAHVYRGYLFNVNPDTKVFSVKSLKDEQVFEDKFNSDFNILAKEFDCIYVSGDYISYLRKNRIETSFFFWTCDCTWWFNIHKLKLIKEINGEQIQKYANIQY